MNNKDDVIRLCGLHSAPAYVHSVTREECNENDPQAKLHYPSAREVLRTSLEREKEVLLNLLSNNEKTAPTIYGEQLCDEDWQNLKRLLIEPAFAASMSEVLVLVGNNLVSDCSRLQKGGKTSIATNPLVSMVSVDNTLDSYRSWLKDEVAGGTLLFNEEELDCQNTVDGPLENVHSFRNAELNKMLKHINALEPDCSPPSNTTDEKTAQQKEIEWKTYLDFVVPKISSNFTKRFFKQDAQFVPVSRQTSNHEERFQHVSGTSKKSTASGSGSGSGQFTNTDSDGCSRNGQDDSGYNMFNESYRNSKPAGHAPRDERNNSSTSRVVAGTENEIEQQGDYDDDDDNDDVDDKRESSIGPLDDNGSIKQASGERKTKRSGGGYGIVAESFRSSSSSCSSSFFGNKRLGSILPDNGAVFDLPVASFNTFPNHFNCQSHGEQSFREDTSQEIEKEINLLREFIRTNRQQGSTRQKKKKKKKKKKDDDDWDDNDDSTVESE